MPIKDITKIIILLSLFLVSNILYKDYYSSQINDDLSIIMNDELVLVVEYVGRIDNHSIEVKSLSTDNPNNTFRAFQLSEEVINNFDGYDLSTSDYIEITFYNDSNNDIVTKIKKYQ